MKLILFRSLRCEKRSDAMTENILSDPRFPNLPMDEKMGVKGRSILRDVTGQSAFDLVFPDVMHQHYQVRIPM